MKEGVSDQDQARTYAGRVLLVDDEPEVLRTLRLQLRREFEVFTAESGPAALELLRRESMDVIVSDQRMPGMNGAELLAAARELSGDSVRIMLTGYSDQSAVVDAVNRARIQGYLTKPWDQFEVRSILRDAIENARLRAENKQLLEDLREANEHLEQKVRQRTRELKVSLQETEQALMAQHESESRLRSLAENAPVGIIRTDPRGLIEYANPFWLRLTGRATGFWEGKPWLESVAADERLDAEKAWGPYQAAKSGTFSAEAALESETGEAPSASFQAVSLFDQSGQSTGFLFSVMDLTALHRLRDALVESRKLEAMARATGGIAHEFNNLLNGAMGYAELALRKLNSGTDPDDAGRYLRSLLDVLRSGRDIVEPMVKYADGSRNPARPTDPAAYVNAWVEAFRDTLPEGIELKLSTEDVALIDLHPDDLHMVMKHLLDNARDALDGYGRIELSLLLTKDLSAECALTRESLFGDWVELAVADSGPGIEPDQVQRIFDPFYTTRPVGQGTGLGLSAVAGVLRARGGHVIVGRSDLGGALFRVLFPLPSRRASQMGAPVRRAPDRYGGGPRATG